MLTEQAVLLLVAGGLVGLSLGVTGSGGSLLAVPLLVYWVGVPVQTATILSLAVVGLSALVGTLEAVMRGDVKVRAGLLFGGTGMAGGWIGAFAHHLVRPEWILVLFGCAAVAAAGQMWHGSRVSSREVTGGRCVDQFPRTCWIKISAIGFLVGLLTGFLGVGGGFIIVPVLSTLVGFPIQAAVGTSLFIVMLVSLGGVTGHLQSTPLQGDLLVPLLAAGGAGVAAGIRMRRGVSAKVVTYTFVLAALALGTFLIVYNLLTVGGKLP
jgi:hypothetical protein